MAELSVRQQIFKELDNMPNVKRTPSANILVEKFGVTIGYARTLFQDHRQLRSTNSNNKSVVRIYKVRDTKSNSPTEPYMTSMVKSNPGENEPRTKEEAITEFIKLAKQNIITATGLA